MAISNLAMRPAEIDMIAAVNAIQRGLGYPEISKQQPMRPAEIELLESVNILRNNFNLILKYLNVYGKSVQDGTPTPENPVPIASIENLTIDTGELSVPVNLQGYQLRSLPNGMRDTLMLTYLQPSTREGWSLYEGTLTLYVGEITLDGSESWNRGSSTYDGMFATNRYVNINGISNVRVPTKDILSPQVIATNIAIWGDPDNHIWECTHNAGQAHVSFDNATVGITTETADRTAAIRAWLTDNPITIYYPLTTPITVALPEIELPDINNVTNIHIIANDDIVVEYDYDYVIRKVIVNR